MECINNLLKKYNIFLSLNVANSVKIFRQNSNVTVLILRQTQNLLFYNSQPTQQKKPFRMSETKTDEAGNFCEVKFLP